MRSANRRTLPAQARKPRDRFRYGVRLVRQRSTDGEEAYVETPMPREALLHPLDEDYPLESDFHQDDCTYLKNALGSRLPRNGVVLCNCRVDWGVPGIEPHGPDITVLAGVRRRRDWKTFYLARENARPVLVIEITSTNTRKNDVKTKVDEYYRAGVPLYAIVDARDKKGARVLSIRGYRRGTAGYEPLPLDEQGRLLLEPLKVLLGSENERVCCYDARTGEKIGDYAAQVQAKQAAEKEAQVAQRARLDAEKRVHGLEAELRRLRRHE